MSQLTVMPKTRGIDAATGGRQVSLPRRLRRNRLLARWMAAWVGAAALGFANAGVRDLVYADRVGELAAHQISTATLLAVLSFYIWLVDRRWPLSTTRDALVVGGMWAMLTVLFEFGLGHYVLGSPWSELLDNYNLGAGRVWVLVPLWMALGPAAVQQRRIRS